MHVEVNMDSQLAIQLMKRIDQLMKNLEQETFSLSEAAAYLKIPVESVEYYSKRQKQLSYIALSGQLVFKRKHLDEFLERKTKKGFVV